MKISALDIHGTRHEIDIDEVTWRPSVYGIVIDAGKILLSPQHGIGYDLPGGGVDIHESFEQAVTREVKEETGIDVRPLQPLGLKDSFFVWKPESENERKAYHSILIYYLCEKIGGEISTDGFDTDEQQYAEAAEWIDIEGIELIHQASSVDFMPYIRKALKAHGN
jgi:8-oxo-dGTP diphosphatase